MEQGVVEEKPFVLDLGIYIEKCDIPISGFNNFSFLPLVYLSILNHFIGFSGYLLMMPVSHTQLTISYAQSSTSEEKFH